MITRNWQKTEPFHKRNGVEGRKIYDMDEGEIIHMTIEPGCDVPQHITPVNVAMYILEGEVVVEIGDEQVLCPPGTMVESPKGVKHALYNLSGTEVRLLVMKLPKPKK
jgi:quercetin dioxygenase-like cupin family protein